MDTKNTPEVWHRLSNESGRAYEAFKVYMFMSPAERSVVGACREWTGNPEAVRPSPFFEVELRYLYKGPHQRPN